MKKNICLVEDDLGISELVCYLLSDVGFEVQACETINAFKDHIKLTIPDLILLDIMLPDGNGIDICRELKAADKTKSIPVILMSAHLTGRSKLNEACADEFISKPFDINDLLSIVEKQLAN